MDANREMLTANARQRTLILFEGLKTQELTVLRFYSRGFVSIRGSTIRGSTGAVDDATDPRFKLPAHLSRIAA
jgi:hypothetical protein